MTSPVQPMPKFDSPPVVETVFGVHFEPLPRFNSVQRSLFWSRIADDFPLVEEKPPVDEVREEFGEDMTVRGVRWQVSDAVPAIRLWAKSPDGRHTVQIQQDALLVNWERDPTTPDPYWHYEERRRDLAEKLGLLERFVRDAKLGEIHPTTCFATYINHIDYDDAEAFAPLLERLLAVWRNDTSDGWLPEIEYGSFRLAFRLPDQRGRLHVHVTPGLRRADKRRILRMVLTARGAPKESTVESALDWIDLGHEWIVRGFASLTRPEMHKLWGKTQ